MKRISLSCLLLVGLLASTNAQNMGLSFSYFIPKHGDFSTPISPFSLRGVGVNLNRFLALQTGVSLYRMSGLNIKDLPFQSDKSLLGPNFTIYVPAELVIQLKGSKMELDLKGGGFFFYGFAQKLNYGNFDRAIRTYQQWDVANSNLSFKNHPGFGPHVGAELTVYVTSQFGISFETNYLMGAAKFPLTGSYTGGTVAGPLQTMNVDYKDAKVDFTGLEFSIGVIMTNGGGKSNPPKRRRR
jgi:hypothetical protein